MKYPNKTVPLHKLILTHQGLIEPLCNYCKTRDCSHPIEPKTVSVFGVNKEMRVYGKGSMDSVVVECEGYSE